MREDVVEWLERPLKVYYLVVFIDAIHVKIRRETVASEAFYVVLGVTPYRRREVLGIAHQQSESAPGCRCRLLRSENPLNQSQTPIEGVNRVRIGRQ